MPAGLLLATATGLNCPKIASVKELYTIKTSDIDSITLGSDHDITNIVFGTAGNGFGKVVFKRGECEMTETASQMNEVNVIFSVPSPTNTQRKQLQAIKDACEQYMVVRLYDGDRFLFVGYDAVVGEEGFVRFNTAASSTGKAKGDAALMTFTMTAEQVELVRGLSGISGATVPATTAVAIAAELIAATSV